MISPDSPPTIAKRALPERWRMIGSIGFLLLIYVVNYADRVIVGVVGEPLKRDLGLSDVQLGLLGGTSFTILYVLTSFPVGRAVERFSRVKILASAIAIWSAGTTLCGFAENFEQLLLCRAAVGIGEGAFVPALLSLLADMFPSNRRATAYSLIVLGIPIGGFAGAVAGGWVAGQFGWQAAFLVVGLPGFFLAFALLALKEPQRGRFDDKTLREDAVPPIRTVLARLARTPALTHLVAGGALVQIIGYAFALFLFPYLFRNFNLSLTETGVIVGVFSAGSAGIGLAFGGVISDWIGQRDVRWYAWLPAIANLIAWPLFILGLFQESWPIAVTLLFIPAAVAIGLSPTITMTIQGLVTPRMRGTTAALNGAIVQIIGFGIGSAMLGLFSDAFTQLSFAQLSDGLDYDTACQQQGMTAASALCIEASGQGLRFALATSSIVLVWAAIHFVLAARHLGRRAQSAGRDAEPGHS